MLSSLLLHLHQVLINFATSSALKCRICFWSTLLPLCLLLYEGSYNLDSCMLNVYHQYHLNRMKIREVVILLLKKTSYFHSFSLLFPFVRCYLFDVSGNVITDPVFLNVSDLNTAAYNGVALGTREGEIMHELIYKHNFFVRKEQIDFQGTCSITKPAPRVGIRFVEHNI